MPKSSKPAFYAVSKGRKTGVFLNWDECEAQVKGFTGARYKKFNNVSEAEAFATGIPVTSPTKPIPDPKPAVTMTGRARSPDVEDESGWDVAYCDGACKGNGQQGSFAGVGVWWGKNDPRNIAERCPGDQTNNRAELIAIVRILETAPLSRKPLLIKTDSQYSINCFKEWLPKWRANGFRSSAGQPVKNVPLIRYLSSLLDVRAFRSQKVRLQYVKGHSGEEGNEGADFLAGQGCFMKSLSERNWEAEEGNVRQLIQNGPSPRVQVTEILEVAGPTASAVPSVVMVQPEDVDFEMYADALLSDEELRELAAKGFESD